MKAQWNHKIFSVGEAGFEALALEIFRFQEAKNPVYKAYVQALGIDPGGVQSLSQIPFLPISFFKSHTVAVTGLIPEVVFESSGTTNSTTSRHFIGDVSVYEESFIRGFDLFYGPVSDWCIIGLLPSYIERGNSSLVYMVNNMTRLSSHPESGFYLDDYDALQAVLEKLESRPTKTLLIGVTYALLDFAAHSSLNLKNTILVETGGMKGKRKEMIRDEVHTLLKSSFRTETVHSEYGMTELLSQAWSSGNGVFRCAPWMKVLIREEDDPLQLQSPASLSKQQPVSGAINIIDLANVYSCSFIATDDIGKLYEDGSFEVQGRFDTSDIRGCNLLIN